MLLLLFIFLFLIFSVVKSNINSIAKYNSIRFCGGGIKFWWQAGCAKYLLENLNTNNDDDKKMKDFTYIGASAGY